MSTLLILVATVLAGVALGLSLLWRSQQRNARLPTINFPGATFRKLTGDERKAAESYLESFNRSRQLVGLSAASSAPQSLTLTPRSGKVICVTRAITRYGLSTDEANKWRYYLDSVEVHLPPFWEPYIGNDNRIELVRTETMPLVISLNGHTLQDYVNDAAGFALENAPAGHSFIRGEESEQVELRHVRQETPEEYALSKADNVCSPLLMVGAFILAFLCLVTPGFLVPWLVGATIILFAAGGWGLFAPPLRRSLREIHCLRGTPKRWGLFGESDIDPMNNISLGIIDLIYPAHWKPFVSRDLGQQTDIDVYLDRRVVRQGPFLSLEDEVTNFPLQRWSRNLVIAIGALLVLIMMTFWVPLDMPLKLTLSWLKGAQTVSASTVAELEKSGLKVGDTLKVKGTGTCNISSTGSFSARNDSPFAPFDCSRMIWNTARALPFPESDTVAKATALLDSVNQQLHPQPGDNDINPQLASAIQRSGMILLTDFADIVKKTQALCTGRDECVRLKNALTNLGNTRDWATLTRRASTGKLDGTNLLLRPVSAESLDNLVTTSTNPFFMRETERAAQALNSPAPGGFVIISDEGNPLVDIPWPSTAIDDFQPAERWSAFHRLASQLMSTPFAAEGIVTSIQSDANGTKHVTLHAIPDSAGVWRNLATTLLLLLLLGCTLWNGVMAVRRYQQHQLRIHAIQQYYENCLSQNLLTSPGNPAD
ncbi:intracellular growth attenuator family protein [Shimwellia pseudoproteus]|uniref:intracellular growth attenuator family protein n=1 Tax=Shimwellia pseudoproteus TaxID=570012 RepID=UPI0018EE1556|nr:intracellular growth attenuator family protein [Shimwellia pseudoproteus]MBJ3815006.1 intracellular growth attenuator family protein [Shimwellia pseudoproteus]